MWGGEGGWWGGGGDWGWGVRHAARAGSWGLSSLHLQRQLEQQLQQQLGCRLPDPRMSPPSAHTWAHHHAHVPPPCHCRCCHPDCPAGRFGSGWAWLIVDGEGKLAVTSTPNQDNPLMAHVADAAGTPVLGLGGWALPPGCCAECTVPPVQGAECACASPKPLFATPRKAVPANSDAAAPPSSHPPAHNPPSLLLPPTSNYRW